MSDGRTVDRLTELLRERNDLQLKVGRVQAEIDALCAAAEIRVAQATAAGSDRDVPAAPRGLPERVKELLDEEK